MEAYVDDLEEATESNHDFRRVLYAGTHLQLVLMALQPGRRSARRCTRIGTSSSASRRERARS
jgi:hypothetical protein